MRTKRDFNQIDYNQIDGVAMGFCLVSVLCNIFKEYNETEWLNEYNFRKPKFYVRYGHDVLADFDKEEDSLRLLNFLNKKHPNFNLQ